MPFYIKRGDTSPTIRHQLLDSNGDAVDLTGASVQFHVRPSEADTLTIDATATIVDAGTGTVEYAWVAGDTDTQGTYRAEWEVTYADSSVETFPNDGYLSVFIRSDLD